MVHLKYKYTKNVQISISNLVTCRIPSRIRIGNVYSGSGSTSLPVRRGNQYKMYTDKCTIHLLLRRTKRYEFQKFIYIAVSIKPVVSVSEVYVRVQH